jgi:hypothetical protein
MKRHWKQWLGLGVLLLLAWLVGPWLFWWLVGMFYGVIPPPRAADDPPFSYPLAKIEKDSRPAFQIDPKKPFRIELGRGSGWFGLDTIKVSEDGTVVIHRQQDIWYKATMQLSEDSLADVLQAVADNRLLGLHKAYHANNVMDGTQWVLWIKQGAEEKSVYFNNHFPKEIVRFATTLDAILAKSGSGNLIWSPASGRDHEKELWKSLDR